MKSPLGSALTGLLTGLLLFAAPVVQGETAPDPLATLRPGHPRLLATADEWAALPARVAADPGLARVNAAILAQARDLLPRAPVERKLEGRRLLGVSRTLVGRVLALSYAWRVTGDEGFVRRAEREMLAAAAFSDWNPSHFLDVGEATAALAIGYDWCYDGLTPAARTAIREAIKSHGLEPGLAVKGGWTRAENNWNQVCFGGLTLGALAIGDEDPAIATRVLAAARAGIGHGLQPYAPDGVYPEGPSYWAYGTGYQVMMIAALQSALGPDWDLPASPGFLPSAGAVLQATGPSGRFYNFADGSEHGAFEPALFWFARELKAPGLLTFNQRFLQPDTPAAALAQNRFLAFAALWWPTRPLAEVAPALPLAWRGIGANPIGVFRTSWTDPSSLYLAFKGGAASLNHAHMDAGSFVLELNGVRWAIDLGSDNYTRLEAMGVDLWNRRQDSQRWQVYRLNNTSHSTLTIDGQPHRVAGNATIPAFSAAPDNRHAVLELTPVFQDQAGRVRRGFRQLSDHVVLIQDEITGLTPGTTVRWQLPTRAQATVAGDTVTLAQDGQTLRVIALSSDQPNWTVTPAEAPADAFNSPNPGVSMVGFTAIAPADGTLRLAVLLGAGDLPRPTLTPLDDWEQPGAPVAPKPLFRDPIHDGAADPVVIWNPSVQRWWMFYTNRRANVPGLSGVAWVHGTQVGIAESADGAHWTYAGTADITLPPEISGTEPTLWAPDVITAPDGTHHMFLTVVPGVFEDWRHPRRIVHLTSPDLRHWTNGAALDLASDRVIDAAVHALPGGGWRMWYNNERDGKSIYYADSPDLNTWTDRGKCTGVGERPGEGPYVFAWKGHYWMLVDLWKGLGVYRSDDLTTWTAQPDNLLGIPGQGTDDGVNGGHPGVVVSGDRAYLFYFTHPGRTRSTGSGPVGTISPDDKANLDLRRSSIQVVELQEQAGVLSCDRDTPTAVALPSPVAATYPNPLIPQRADPHIVRQADGTYTFMGTVPEYDRLILRRADTIAGLATAPEKVIWQKHATGPMGAHIWAPELHRLDGKWYIYFAAGDAEKVWNIRLYVLENASPDPLAGEWIERGRLDTGWSSFALDASVFENRGVRYLIWAQAAPGIKANTCLFIAPLATPTTLAGPAVMLSQPEFAWEKVRYAVNEGPVVLQRNGRIFLSYSAAGTGPEYCLGLLTADADADLLDPKSWVKSPEPVFTTSGANHIYGPGHHSFTVAEDGVTDLLVYHARSYRDIVGDPLRDPNRHTRVQPVTWRADGTPDFGVPRADDPTP